MLPKTFHSTNKLMFNKGSIKQSTTKYQIYIYIEKKGNELMLKLLNIMKIQQKP